MSQHVTGDPDRLVGVSTHVTLGFFKVIPKTSASCVSAFLDSFFFIFILWFVYGSLESSSGRALKVTFKVFGKKMLFKGARDAHESVASPYLTV